MAVKAKAKPKTKAKPPAKTNPHAKPKAQNTTRATKAKSRKAAPRPAPRPKAPLKGKPVEIKTRPTGASVEAFLNAVPDERKRKDGFVLLDMMRKASGQEPRMWGASLIGFGQVTVKSPATGREVEWLQIGFSPRKASLSLYLTGDLSRHAAALKKLGKHKTGVGCLYINKLEDVDVKVLDGMIKTAFKTGFVSKAD